MPGLLVGDSGQGDGSKLHCLHFFVIADLEGVILESAEFEQFQVDNLLVATAELSGLSTHKFL